MNMQSHRPHLNFLLAFLLMFLLRLAVTGLVWAEPSTTRNTADSEAQTTAGELAGKVKELLRARCSQCHGDQQQIADLNVMSHTSLLANDQVVPGDVNRSRLYEIMIEEDEDSRMPKGAPPLSEKELAMVRRWIEAD